MSQVREVGGVINNKDTVNGDVYLVATKLVTQTKALPLVLNVGVRGTNAELWGMGGNTPNWEAKVFGAEGFVVKLPHKASAIFGAEVAQQPKHPSGLPDAVIPTTITYAVRLSPVPESKLNLDFGIAQIAGAIMPGVNLESATNSACKSPTGSEEYSRGGSRIQGPVAKSFFLSWCRALHL